MSYALMLSPCKSLGLNLQCFTWLGKMVQRFIDTHFRRSAVRLTISRLSCALMKVFFHVSGIQPHRTSICFICHLLKNFQNSSFNEPDSFFTVSYHQVCQERQFQTYASLLFLTFYGRAPIDLDPPRGS